MKVICTKSHEQPNTVGGFDVYTKSIEYDLDKYDTALFEPVKKKPNRNKSTGGTE